MPQPQDMELVLCRRLLQSRTILASNNSILRCIYRNELANWTGLRQKHHLLDFKLTRGTTFWPFNFRIFHKDLSLLLGATVQSRHQVYPGHIKNLQEQAEVPSAIPTPAQRCSNLEQPGNAETTWIKITSSVAAWVAAQAALPPQRLQ